MRAGPGHDLGRVAIERRHHGERLPDGTRGILVPLRGRGDDPEAQGLAQDQRIARPGAGVGDHVTRVNPADDRQAEDRLLRLDRMAAHDRDARLARPCRSRLGGSRPGLPAAAPRSGTRRC